MRWIIRIVGTLVVLVAIFAGAALLVPTERIAGLAADRFEAATGRTMRIDGPVRATLWPGLAVRMERITVANPDWAGDAPLLDAGRVEVGVPLSAIWGGPVRIETLEIRDAVVTLVRDVGGAESWDLARPGGGSGGGGGSHGGSTLVPVERAFLAGAEVVYEDRAAGTGWRLRAVDLEARLPDAAGALDLVGSALIGGQAVAMEAQVARLAALLDGKLTPLSATFSSGGTVLSVAGRGDLTPAFEGRTDIASTDGFAMLDAFGWTVPDLPDGLGARSVDMAGDLTLASAGTVHLRDLSAVLDGNTLAGDVDIDPSGERPRVTATLAAEALDLTGLSRKGQGGETALVAETGWAREGIDVSGLFAVDGDVALATGPVTLGDAVIDETRAVVVLDRGRAVVSLQPVAAYGGTVTGEVVVNGRGGLSVRAGLDLAGLRMQPFLTAFAGWDRLIGTADARIDLLGAGDTAQ
ncbi:MAG: AsmA family protein, partial [Pseudomonadota bacterium]